MRITKFSCQDMWSFGKDGIEIADFSRHNILIGKNNAGKSKVLAGIRWVKENANAIANQNEVPLQAEVFHEVGDSRPISPAFSLTLDLGNARDALLNKVSLIQNGPITKKLVAEQVGQAIEFTLRAPSIEKLTTAVQVGFGVPFDSAVEQISRNVSVNTRPQIAQHWPIILRNLIHIAVEELVAPTIKYVGGWRSLRAKVEGEHDIIKCLHLWRDPPQKQKHLRHKFTRVQSLFRDLMLDSELELRPESSGQNLALAAGGTYLPIDSYGDGVHHLLMIAYYLATAPDSILLVEEPETHLHPELQRNLMRVLRRDLQGQIFITTHSPVLLDAATTGGKVFRVERLGGYSSVQCCETSAHLLKTLDDLDVRASDLLQANLVIWVEGPTDRMFIKKCFELREEAFAEGVHYQFAYYGGRLRSHFTFDEHSADELVNLLKVSRHVAMVCDSDKHNNTTQIDGTKERLRRECEAVGGFYWVTDGREIENYFPDEVLTAAYNELMGDPNSSVSLSQFQKLDEAVSIAFPGRPAYGQGWKVAYEDNKARLMPYLLKHLSTAHLSRWHLNERLDGLVGRIKQANPN